MYVLHRMNCNLSEIQQWKEQKRLSPEDLDELPPSQYRSLWGSWEGREQEFFVKSFQMVRELSPESFLQITGVQQENLLHQAQAARQEMLDPVLPPVLKRNPDLRAERWKGQYILSTDRGFYQPSPEVYEALDLFNGHRKTAQVIRHLREKKNRMLETELLTYLYQTRILVPA